MVDSSPVVLQLSDSFSKNNNEEQILEEHEETESDQFYEAYEKEDKFRNRLGSTASVLEAKTRTFERVKEELHKAQQALQLKDDEVNAIREKMDHEIEELTASLFVEAHAMVREANIKQAEAEKKLSEAQGKIDVLQAEVTALKALVITSTPSMPLPPTQHSPKKSISILKRYKAQNAILNQQMSMYSHHWRNPALLNVPLERCKSTPSLNESSAQETKEADPIMLHEFEAWRQSLTFSMDSPFMKRVHQEDILPCLTFPNNALTQMVQTCVLKNSLCIEPINGSPSTKKKCALFSESRICKYRLKLEDSDKWCDVCCSARNRITAVCNFFTYLRYIQQGLVKSDTIGMYWEVVRLRKEIALAKLSL
ncbi:guanine nucleotide exchange factor for Rab-3A-like [Anneissia japonica]|uniref:guanine nucleotide exchange factor for Rab-3A-like n=1 Tax=Anneissia japonica TaxID=1529436 RepID=UPI001425A4E2|nr:guanine nucleotide exchange factor for Rab-3A-like [Anneissia japonica]